MQRETEFSELVMSKVIADGPFATQVVYDADGDCIEFLASNEGFYAERIDSLVTVYYGRESGDVIGSLIKGVRGIIAKLSETFPGFRIEIEDGRIKLEHLFTAKMWSSKDQPAVLTYRKLRDVAERTGAEAELCMAP